MIFKFFYNHVALEAVADFNYIFSIKLETVFISF